MKSSIRKRTYQATVCWIGFRPLTVTAGLSAAPPAVPASQMRRRAVLPLESTCFPVKRRYLQKKKAGCAGSASRLRILIFPIPGMEKSTS